MFLYKNKCLIPLLKTAVFQGFSRATSIPRWPAHRRAHGTMWLGPIPPSKKSKRPHPGTQILSQIPEGGEGNRGQMPHICSGFPYSGLTLIDALESAAKFVENILPIVNECKGELTEVAGNLRVLFHSWCRKLTELGLKNTPNCTHLAAISFRTHSLTMCVSSSVTLRPVPSSDAIFISWTLWPEDWIRSYLSGDRTGNFVEWQYFECPGTFKTFVIKKGMLLNHYSW